MTSCLHLETAHACIRVFVSLGLISVCDVCVYISFLFIIVSFFFLFSFQCVNHFAGIDSLSRKKQLGIHLNAMRCVFPHLYDFYPLTFVLLKSMHACVWHFVCANTDVRSCSADFCVNLC